MLTSLALTSILGGAVGNMIDRFEFGPVLDVIELKLGSGSIAPLNIADIAIIVGVGIVFVNTLIQQRVEKKI